MALNLGAVGLTTGRLMILGGKDRVTALGDRSRRMLAASLELERPDAPLWCSHSNVSHRTADGRLTDTGLRQLLERIGKRAGVKHAHPHTFRRTCALMMHRSGARLTEIAQLLGHSDLQMLKRYLDLAGEDAANARRWHGLMDALTRQQAI